MVDFIIGFIVGAFLTFAGLVLWAVIGEDLEGDDW